MKVLEIRTVPLAAKASVAFGRLLTPVSSTYALPYPVSSTSGEGMAAASSTSVLPYPVSSTAPAERP